jgi:hypothetical protein
MHPPDCRARRVTFHFTAVVALPPHLIAVTQKFPIQ